MTDPKQLTALFVCHGNEIAIEAARRLGVPLGRVQKLIMSDEWKTAHKEAAAAKVKQVKEQKG